MKQYPVIKPFKDENGDHAPGDKPLSLSENRAVKLKSRGYIGSAIEEKKTQTVTVDIDSEEVREALKCAADSLAEKMEEVETLKKSHSEELERVNSRLSGLISSIKSAKTIIEVNSIVAALEEIEG